MGKRLLESYQWWRFEPHPEWVEPHWGEGDFYEPYATGVPRGVRIICVPWHGKALWNWIKIKGIEQVDYRAFYFDPKTGKRYNIGKVIPDENGEWKPPLPVTLQDWVLVLERIGIKK
ncbi:MAG: putative collagen-binding domain-containing protein [Thermoproteota archaeon]